MNDKKADRGFTLIELLTVMAIIGILAAILIPVVSNVREAAKGAKCTSNIRQSALALLAFVDDNNGKFIGTWIPGDPDKPYGGGRTYWARVLTALGYSDDPLVFFDPMWKPQPGEQDLLADPSRNAIWPWAASYAASRTGLMPANSEGEPASIDSVARSGVTSRIIMLTEARLTDTQYAREEVVGFAGFRAQSGPDPRLDYRHNDGLNAAFADGHVERFTRSQMMSFDDPTKAPWFTDVFLP